MTSAVFIFAHILSNILSVDDNMNVETTHTCMLA